MRAVRAATCRVAGAAQVGTSPAAGLVPRTALPVATPDILVAAAWGLSIRHTVWAGPGKVGILRAGIMDNKVRQTSRTGPVGVRVSVGRAIMASPADTLGQLISQAAATR